MKNNKDYILTLDDNKKYAMVNMLTFNEKNTFI